MSSDFHTHIYPRMCPHWDTSTCTYSHRVLDLLDPKAHALLSHMVFPHCEIGALERWNYILAARVIFLKVQLQPQDSVVKITPEVVYSYQESMWLCWSPPAKVKLLTLKAHINPHIPACAPTRTDPQTHHWHLHFDDCSPSVCKPAVPQLQSVCTLSGKPVEMFIILRLTLLRSSVLVDLGRGS